MIIHFHKNFEKRYAKLPKKIRESFKKRRDVFIKNTHDPLLSNHALKGKFVGYRSINVTGDFRAVYKQTRESVFEFADIGTHHELFGT